MKKILTVSCITILLQASFLSSIYAAPAPQIVTGAYSEEEEYVDSNKSAISVNVNMIPADTYRGDNPPSRTITVSNSSAGTLSYKISSDAPWILINPAEGTAAGRKGNQVEVKFNTSGLDIGDHAASISIEDPGAQNSPLKIPVTVTVKRKAVLSVDPETIELKVKEGKKAEDKSFGLYNGWDDRCNYRITSKVAWLSADQSSGILEPRETKVITIHYGAETLKAGAHTGSLKIESPDAENSPRAVVTNIRVMSSQPLSISASSLKQKCFEGDPAKNQTLTMENTTEAKISYKATAYADWMSVSPQEGELAPLQEGVLAILYSTDNLAEGDYNAEILLYQEGVEKPTIISVTLSIEPKPLIGLSVKELRIKAEENAAPKEETVSISNDGGGELKFRINSNASWLSVEPKDGSLAKDEEKEIKILCNSESFPIGENRANLEITSEGTSNSPQNIPVTLVVKSKPEIKVSPLKFITKAKEGEKPFPEPLLLTNMGQEEIEYKIASDVEWLAFKPASGKLVSKKPLAIKTVYNTETLTVGEYSGAVTIETGDGDTSSVTIPVTFTVKGPEMILSVESLSPGAIEGEDAETETFMIANAGGGKLSYSLKSAEDWILVKPAKGIVKSGEEIEVTVTYKTSKLEKGKYSSVIEIASEPKTIGQAKIPVKLDVKKKKKKAAAPAAMPIGYAQDTIWTRPDPLDEVRRNFKKPDYQKGVSGPLADLLIDFNNTCDRSAGSYHDDAEKIRLMQSFYNIQRPHGKCDWTSQWTLNIDAYLFGPRDKMSGYDKQSFYYAAASHMDSLQKQAKSGSGFSFGGMTKVPLGLDGYLFTYSNRGNQNTEYYILGDGFYIVLRGDYYTPCPRCNIQIAPVDFKPYINDIYKRAAAKTWQSLFPPSGGKPRYDMLPKELKPFIKSIGMQDPWSINFNYGPLDPQEYMNWGLFYGTSNLISFDDPAEWNCDVNMTFYYPSKAGIDRAKESFIHMDKNRWDGYTRTRVQKGDEGYKYVRIKESSNSLPDISVDYMVRKGSVIILYGGYRRLMGRYGNISTEPPDGILDEIVDEAGKADLKNLFTFTGQEAGESEPEEEEAPVIADQLDVEEPEAPQISTPSDGASPAGLPGSPAREAYEPKPGEKSVNGLVYSGTFNDWVKPTVYDNEQEQSKLGRAWQGDKWGWETPGETKERQKNVRNFEVANKIADVKMRAELKEITDDINRIKTEIKQAEVKKKKTEILRKQLDNLEDQRKRDEEDASSLSAEVLENTVYSTARAAVTGVNADGSTSYMGIGGRMAAATFTGGYSEVAYNVANFGYRINDNLKENKGVSRAIAKAYGSMLVDEAIGRASGGMISFVGNKVMQGGKKLLGTATESAEKAVTQTAKAEVSLTKELAGKKASMEAALAITDEAERALAVKKLYQNNGMKDLAGLEAKGLITPKQAKEMGGVIRSEVKEAVKEGVSDTVKKVEGSVIKYKDKLGNEKTVKVKIEEVHVGDSGSSAVKGKAVSVKTDVDNTYVPVFSKDTVKEYADAFCGGDQLAANAALTNRFTNVQTKSMKDALKTKNLAAKDVDYKCYAGFGAESGHSDSYAGGFVPTLQAARGKTTVFKVGENSKITANYETSGRTIVDQYELTRSQLSGGKVAPSEAPKILAGEGKDIMAQQTMAMQKTGITSEKASKALLRADKAAALAKSERIDPALAEKARLLRDNPQNIAAVIGDEAAQEAFIKQVDDAVKKADEAVAKK